MSHITPASVSGSVYGLALGDAWGAPTEFLSHDEIIRTHGRTGPDFPYEHAHITDDTQMSLYVLRALREFHSGDARVQYPLTHDDMDYLAQLFGQHFIDWLHDPENYRAPGNTCLRALRKLEAVGLHRVTDATVMDSKGCGANMRAPWVGLDVRIPDAEVSEIAMIQAYITHGHPTALVSSAITARLTRYVARGAVQPGDLSYAALDIAQAHGDIGRETAAVLSRAISALETVEDPWSVDPCYLVGQAWTAEEALAVATYVVDVMANEDPHDALRRAAATNGDSDSIGALVGGLLGATGIAWNPTMIDSLEDQYKTELADAIVYLTSK